MEKSVNEYKKSRRAKKLKKKSWTRIFQSTVAMSSLFFFNLSFSCHCPRPEVMAEFEKAKKLF